MSGASLSLPASGKLALGAFLGVALASALDLPVSQYLFGVSVPLGGVAALALTLGFEEIAKAFFRPVVGLVALGLAAPAMGGLVRAVLADPRVQGGLCVVSTLVAVVAALVLLSKAATVKLPEKRKVPKALIRERVALVEPLNDDPLARPPKATSKDEIGLFGGGAP